MTIDDAVLIALSQIVCSYVFMFDNWTSYIAIMLRSPEFCQEVLTQSARLQKRGGLLVRFFKV